MFQASSLPRCATFAQGVHNMELLSAVAQSAASGGSYAPIPAAKVAGQPSTKEQV